MGSIAVPDSRVQTFYVGSTTVTDPLLMLSIDGVVYPNGYRIEYSGGYRNIFPSITSNGSIYVESQCIAYGADVPAIDLYSVEVIVIG